MAKSASLLKRGGIFMCGYSCMEKLKLHKKLLLPCCCQESIRDSNGTCHTA